MPLFVRPIESALFNMKLRAGHPLTELQFYAKELAEWETSAARKEMLDGDRYYMGEHDILSVSAPPLARMESWSLFRTCRITESWTISMRSM